MLTDADAQALLDELRKVEDRLARLKAQERALLQDQSRLQRCLREAPVVAEEAGQRQEE